MIDLNRVRSWEKLPIIPPIPTLPSVNIEKSEQEIINGPYEALQRLKHRRASLPTLPVAVMPVPFIGRPHRRSSLPSLVEKPTEPAGRPTRKQSKSGSASERLKSAHPRVKIPPKEYFKIKRVFDEHDKDQDGVITQEEFVKAISRLEGGFDEIEERFSYLKQNQRTKPDGVEVDPVDRSHRARRGFHMTLQRHAEDMFLGIMAKEEHNRGGITLPMLVNFYYPHLDRAAIHQICQHYHKEQPVPVLTKEKTIQDIHGAEEEIRGIFESIERNPDGLLRVQDLGPLLQRTGLRESDLEEWLAELPVESPTPISSDMGPKQIDRTATRRKQSLLNFEDFKRLLAPVYLEKLKLDKNKHQLSDAEFKRIMQWDQELSQTQYTVTVG